MPVSSLARRSLADLREERAALRHLHDTVAPDEPPRDAAVLKAALRRGLRFAINAIESEVVRRVDERTAPMEPVLDWTRLGEWLGRYVRDAEDHDDRVRELTQQVCVATAALAGEDGDAFTAALRAQENAIWASIRHRLASEEASAN
jgi:hypothetical protein